MSKKHLLIIDNFKSNKRSSASLHSAFIAAWSRKYFRVLSHTFFEIPERIRADLSLFSLIN